MTDKQKLAFAVKTIYTIQAAWDQLITTGPIPVSSFDEGSLKTVSEFKNYLRFEAVFRLVPDMLVKGFKLIELCKIWYNSARRMGGTEPVSHRTIEDFLDEITICDKAIDSLGRQIQHKRNSRIAKQSERKMLVNQILRLDEIKENYDECVEKERELKEHYKQLKVQRNSEYSKLDKLPRDDPAYKVSYEQIQYLAESMKAVYRELQTESYQLALVKQDYMVQIDTRANLIRMQDDVKLAIQDIDISLPLDEHRKVGSQYSCEKLRANITRMWMALYKSRADNRLTKQADNVLQCKYSKIRINSRSDTVASNPSHSVSSDDEAHLDQVIQETLTNNSNMARENTGSERGTTPDSDPLPPKPLPPATQRSADNNRNRHQTVPKNYNPSSAGILDKHEAREYRHRVERLKKGFEVDLSNLKTTIDCRVDVRKKPHIDSDKTGVQSGDEADMESEPEEKSKLRPQSKRLTRRSALGRSYSPLSDVSDDYIYQQQLRSPGNKLFNLLPLNMYK